MELATTSVLLDEDPLQLSFPSKIYLILYLPSEILEIVIVASPLISVIAVTLTES